LVEFDMGLYVPNLWRKFDFGLRLIHSEDQGNVTDVLEEIHL
jgi:hypothetical protein